MCCRDRGNAGRGKLRWVPAGWGDWEPGTPVLRNLLTWLHLAAEGRHLNDFRTELERAQGGRTEGMIQQFRKSFLT